MTSSENSITSAMIPSALVFDNLYHQYPITYLSFSDLHTYEVLILLVYGIMIIFSFFTNFIAIVIFLFGRRSRSELTPFLLNLSVFNIIMTVYCMPFTITSVIFQRWLYAGALCVVLDGFKTFSVSGVLLTLIIIAIDRYCVLKYPLTIKIYSPKKRNLLAILIIWIFSILLAIIWSPARSSPKEEKRLWVNSRTLLDSYLKSMDNLTDLSKSKYLFSQLHYEIVNTLQCVPNGSERPVAVRRTILNFLQTYFIPLFILAFVYLRIAVLLWQRRNDVTSDLNNPASKNLFTNENIQFRKKLKQGIRMLVAVVILYAILWLPMNLFQLCLNLLCYPGTKHQQFCGHPTLLQLLYIMAHFLTVSNTALNPIIYGFTNNRFRSDIRQLRRRLIHCEARTPFYFQSRFAQMPPQELEARHNNTKRNPSLPGVSNQQTNRILIGKRLASLSDQNKIHRTAHTSAFLDKDHLTTKTRHTT